MLQFTHSSRVEYRWEMQCSYPLATLNAAKEKGSGMFSTSGACSHSMVHKHIAKHFHSKWSGGPKLPTDMNLLWPELLFEAGGKGDHEKVLKPVP